MVVVVVVVVASSSNDEEEHCWLSWKRAGRTKTVKSHKVFIVKNFVKDQNEVLLNTENEIK